MRFAKNCVLVNNEVLCLFFGAIVAFVHRSKAHLSSSLAAAILVLLPAPPFFPLLHAPQTIPRQKNLAISSPRIRAVGYVTISIRKYVPAHSSRPLFRSLGISPLRFSSQSCGGGDGVQVFRSPSSPRPPHSQPQLNSRRGDSDN